MEDGNSKLAAGNSEAGGQPPVPIFESPLSTGLPPDRSLLRYVLIAAAVMAVLVVIAALVSRWRTQRVASPPEPTAEEKSYFSQIRVADARMSAATNFLGQRVILLDARISNSGARDVKQVDISMEFADVMGQVILRERAAVFPPASPPLKAGETRDFQLFFDHIPSGWNQAPPRIAVVGVQF
jgi:hypothetical protein